MPKSVHMGVDLGSGVAEMIKRGVQIQKRGSGGSRKGVQGAGDLKKGVKRALRPQKGGIWSQI